MQPRPPRPRPEANGSGSDSEFVEIEGVEFFHTSDDFFHCLYYFCWSIPRAHRVRADAHPTRGRDDSHPLVRELEIRGLSPVLLFRDLAELIIEDCGTRDSPFFA